MNRYWILLYDPARDRQVRVFRDALSLDVARDEAERDTGMQFIAAGLNRKGRPMSDDAGTPLQDEP